MTEAGLPAIFESRPAAAATWYALVRELDDLAYEIEERKTCVHLVAGRGAFLGVRARGNGLRLTIPLSRPLESVRIAKTERASAQRYHNDLDITMESIDAELIGWIREAYTRNMPPGI